jgi:DNA-binding response OmpR family regulator
MGVHKTILVIDDSETTLVLLEWFLKDNGFDTLIALDIKSALLQIDKQLPDLILLDLQLPEISGYDFLKMIKTDKNKKDIPVIVISALDSQEAIRQLKHLGAIDFIPKPLNLKMLVDHINIILKPGNTTQFYF